MTIRSIGEHTARIRAVSDQMRVLGDRVRLEREKAGLSMSQLCTAAGISKAHLIKIENGSTNPSLGVLRQIADALELTIADLVGRGAAHADLEETEIPPSLRAFADEAKLTSGELRTLASIRWRTGDEPRTPERWRYIFDSLRLSRSMDGKDDAAK